MEIDQIARCNSLIIWIQSLKVNGPQRTAQELCDGVAMSQTLLQICPEFFTTVWASKIKTDVGENWRLKVSNLRKIVERIIDYYTDILNLNLGDFVRPDVIKIGEKGDLVELGRLLQLILVCAVNCEQKQEYITQIMDLEISCQRSIMQALQELEVLTQGRGRAPMSIINPEIESARIQSLIEERDMLAQRCHELDIQVAFINDEKNTLQQETLKLQKQIREFETPHTIGLDGESIGPVTSGGARYSEMRRQLDFLKEELFKVETARDDLRLKSEHQEKELVYLQSRVEELQSAAVEASQLKDEVDALRESNDKLKIYESTIASYKKKLDEQADLKRQIKMLEERNVEYLRQTMDLEEGAKKQGVWKSQIEIYKKQLLELHTKLDTEITKSDKIDFENKTLETKIAALQRERDNLLVERDSLKEACEELQCGNVSKDMVGDTVSRELLSPQLKERLDRLETENKILREGEGGQAAMQALLDDATQRMEQLRTQLRQANQKILQLQGQEKDAGRSDQIKQATELGDNKEDTATAQAALKQRVLILQEALAQKEADFSATEEKYKRCIEKAKEVIKTLDTKAIGHQSLPDNLVSKPVSASSELESRLLASAFHRLGLACHREALDQRLAQLSPGQSFLSRQRQPPARKPLGGFKNK